MLILSLFTLRIQRVKLTTLTVKLIGKEVESLFHYSCIECNHCVHHPYPHTLETHIQDLCGATTFPEDPVGGDIITWEKGVFIEIDRRGRPPDRHRPGQRLIKRPQEQMAQASRHRET